VGHNTINYELWCTEDNRAKKTQNDTFSRQKKYTHTRIKLWEREREEKRMYDVDVERS
jgi:hypothetical protein